MKNIVLAAVAALATVAGAFWYLQGNAPRYSVEMDTRDSIQSWDFQGSHKDGGALEARVRTDIAKLEEALKDESQDPTDYMVYVSIASNYSLLGEGKNSLISLEEALAVDSTQTGLAWHNVAVLMERFGALNTARTAYARAVEAQPHVDAYHVARLNFLTKHFSEDKEAVQGAISEAVAQFGEEEPFIMQARANWFEAEEMWQEAIRIWESFRATASPDMKEGIDAKLKDLKKNL